MPIRKWFEKFLAPARTRPIRRAPSANRARPTIEALECRVVPAVITPEIEPNDTVGAPQTVTLGANNGLGDILTTAPADWLTINATMTGDADFFRFVLPATATQYGVFFDIDTPTGSTVDTNLQLFDVGGNSIMGAMNDNGYDFDGFTTPTMNTNDATSPDSSLYRDLMSGTYTIRVSGAGTGNYTLRILADSNYSVTAPTLNSRTVATDTLYLDFDSYTSPPGMPDVWSGGLGTTASAFNFSPSANNGNAFIDNAGTFSPAERLAIRNIWSIVSEDYAPYNINVSTVEPMAFTDGVAFRQVITNTGPVIIDPTVASTALGTAKLNGYASGGATDNVGFTFASNFADFGGGASGEIAAKSVERGNTSSQQFGRALGLRNYASGGMGSPPLATPPQPNGIMAEPDLGLNRETFSAATNDAGASQVDSGTISGPSNTFGLIIDEHGDTTATATALTPDPAGNGSSYVGTGLIRQESDIDYFSFIVGGNTTITIDVDDFAGNLDATLTLFDSNGMMIGSPTNLANSLDATINTNLPDGTYFIAVSGGTVAGNVGRYTVNITSSVTLAPVITTTSSTTAWIQNGPAVAVDPLLTVFDRDSAFLARATVTISGGYVQGQDVLSLDNGFGVLGTFNTTTGVLTLIGQATPQQYQTALRNVKYSNTANAASLITGTRNLTIQADDVGPNNSPGLMGAGAFKDVSVSIAPVLTESPGTSTFTENAGAVAVDPNITVADNDSTTLESATVAITNGFVNGDRLLFTNQNGISGMYNGTTGVLTLTGTASLANYQTALQSVTFDVGPGLTQNAENPTAGTRTVTFTAFDDVAPGPSVTKTVGVIPINDGPMNTVPAGPLTTAEDVARALSGIVINDIDSAANPIQVTLSVGAGTITVNTGLMGGVVASQVSGNGTGTVILTAPISAINTTLGASPLYTPAADANGPDTLTVATNDLGSSGGSPLTDTDTVALAVTEVNDAPVAVADTLPTVAVGSGPLTFTFASLLGNDRAGPTNEAAQTLTLTTVGGAIGGTVAIVGGAVQFTPTANFSGTASFFYSIQDDGTTNGMTDAKTAAGQASFTIGSPPPPPATSAPAPAAPAPAPVLAVAVGGIAALVDTNGAVRVVVNAFPGFTGVSAASGDVNGDGITDLIATAKIAGFAAVRVFNGANGSLMSEFFAFPTAAPSVFLTTADLNGDGRSDILLAPLGLPFFIVFSGLGQSFLGFSLNGSNLI